MGGIKSGSRSRAESLRAEDENNSDHPHPHICKKYAPKICHTMGVRMAYHGSGNDYTINSPTIIEV